MAENRINAAFHSILEHTETLGLNEGDFLTLNNTLKKAFDNPREATEFVPIQSPVSLIFQDTIDNADLKVCIVAMKRPQRPDTGLRVQYSLTSANVFIGLYETSYDSGIINSLLRRHQPLKVSQVANGMSTSYSYEKFLERMKNEDEDGDGDEDGDEIVRKYSMFRQFLCGILDMSCIVGDIIQFDESV